VAGVGGPLLYLITFGLAFGDASLLLDLFVPGEVGMVVAGASGDRADLPLPALVLAGATGAIVGDSVSYFVGRRWGLALVRRWEFVRRRLEPNVVKAQRYFEHRGGPAVFVGRWVGALRAVVPLVAGVGRMPYPRFLLWDALGATTWVATVITLGYVLGRRIAEVVDRYALGLSVLVVLVLATIWLVRRRRRARAGADAVPPSSTADEEEMSRPAH
jgi:membrane-associated protein